jgi:membrane protein insertase Oxa1/YidC/SpoIIIJ
MICLWIAQHKVMPQPENSGPDQERMKKMMMGMQVFFAFLFYSYASGLALYMITSSSIAIFETVVIKKVWPIDDSELEKKKPGRFMQRVAAMQKEQLRRAQDEGKRKKQQKKKHR